MDSLPQLKRSISLPLGSQAWDAFQLEEKSRQDLDLRSDLTPTSALEQSQTKLHESLLELKTLLDAQILDDKAVSMCFQDALAHRHEEASDGLPLPDWDEEAGCGITRRRCARLVAIERIVQGGNRCFAWCVLSGWKSFAKQRKLKRLRSRAMSSAMMKVVIANNIALAKECFLQWVITFKRKLSMSPWLLPVEEVGLKSLPYIEKAPTRTVSGTRTRETTSYYTSVSSRYLSTSYVATPCATRKLPYCCREGTVNTATPSHKFEAAGPCHKFECIETMKTTVFDIDGFEDNYQNYENGFCDGYYAQEHHQPCVCREQPKCTWFSFQVFCNRPPCKNLTNSEIQVIHADSVQLLHL